MQPTEVALADCTKAYLEDFDSPYFTNEREFFFELLYEHHITSPPEQLFLAAWCIHERLDIGIRPQLAIGKYRTDFSVCGLDHFINHIVAFPLPVLEKLSALLPRYAIEIDGFEWHDKTPAQAEADKKRERAIQKEGFTVLRFAAREVLRDPDACADEVVWRIQADIAKIYTKLVSAL